MPVKIKPIGARGGPRGAMEADRIESAAKRIAKAADPSGRLSKQDLARAYNIARGMISPKYVKEEAASRKKKQSKRMGGKVAPKKMMYGGKAKKK